MLPPQAPLPFTVNIAPLAVLPSLSVMLCQPVSLAILQQHYSPFLLKVLLLYVTVSSWQWHLSLAFTDKAPLSPFSFSNHLGSSFFLVLFPHKIPLPSITLLVGSDLLLLASMCPWTLHCCPECWTFTATSNRAAQADCQHRLFTLWLQGAIIFPIINHQSMPSSYFQQPACAAPTQSTRASVWLTVFLRFRPHCPRLGEGGFSSPGSVHNFQSAN